MDIVTGALSSLLPKLGDLLAGEYKLQKGVKAEIMFLQAELESMHGALKEISMAPVDRLHNHDKIWARDVRELSYDIEDSIDTFMVRGECSEVTGPPGFKKFIDRCFDLLTRFQIRRNIATEIRDIKRRVIEVCERRDRYKIDNIVAKPSTDTVDPRLLAQYKKTTELVGIDDARDELIEILTEGNEVSEQQGKIVSIVGFGGLGKTTLANAVYKKLRERFDCCAFVSVSQTPDMKKLFKDMLYNLGRNYNERTLDERQLINELRKFLHEKRYFIVVDDIWDISVWKMIRCGLPENNCGYKIITTTRIFDVAKQVGGSYKMKPLSLANSRILLYSRIFGNDNKNSPDEELAEISDRILKKCAGVPLAVITIASLLASKGRNKVEWFEVYNSIGTGLESNLDVENMRKILLFSYYDMPSHLRTCLLYLSVFPEDYNIEKTCLIWTWIAEGFIQCGKQGMNLFELGESYFKGLINRSMIEPVYDSIDDMIAYCRVHDMVLDLIRSLSNEENFVTILNDVDHTSPSKKVRRLSLQNSKTDHTTPWATNSMQQVRSVVVFPSAVDIMPALESFKVLRVLHLEGCDLSQGFSLKYIGSLFHLRYLGLRSTRTAQLPEELTNLLFLQTLDVSCNIISTFPSAVVQLRNLMCLHIDDDTRVPNGIIGSLTSLEELSTLCIDNSTGIVEELGHLTELRVLEIVCHIEWNDALEKSLVACLCKMQKIQSLSIWVSAGEFNLDGWAPPRHLRRLQLMGCCFSTLTDWMSPSLLVVLSSLYIGVSKLRQEDLEILGRLPSLCYLNLEVDHQNLGILGRFFVGACSFPCLVECVLQGFGGPVVFQQGAMPRLAILRFTFPVREAREFTSSNGGFDLGLGNLSCLQNVTVYLQSEGASKEEVEEAKAALRRRAEIHLNRPTLEIVDNRFGED